ncbi:MAG: type II toxin-antitoxin system VapC family toxin [Planctomycetes bacterium]|nr:type II toxin-antitoxin system VapC family toxin [Planctomycetota bacterium]
MIFVDSNIPMYLVGGDDKYKSEARRLLERCIDNNERMVTDAEVFQEILHRYAVLRRKDAIGPAFECLLHIVDETFSIELTDVARARSIVTNIDSLSARDALHLAVMERRGVPTILSFDAGFDAWPTVKRIG